MIGARFFTAMSWILVIFCACVFAKRSAEDREILGENIDRAAVDRAPAGHHAVAGDLGRLHAEVVAAVLDEHVELLEGVVVEQEFDALAGGELALGVLRCDALLAAAEACAIAAGVQLGEDVFHGFRGSETLLGAGNSTSRAAPERAPACDVRMTGARNRREPCEFDLVRMP